MKLSELYSEYFANWISDGSMINRDKISLLGIRPLFDRFLTNQYITRVWMVGALPVHYQRNLTQMIRMEMYEQFPEVKTIVHMYNTPVNVRVNSDVYERQMNASAKRYYQYKDVFDSLSDVERETGVSERVGGGVKLSIDRRTLSRIQDSYDSYMYVHSEANKGKSFTNTHYFIQASCADKERMKKYEHALMGLLRGQGVAVKQIRGNIGQYLDNFCPAAFKQSDISKFPTMLLSQDNVAALVPSKTKGLVGGGRIMLGQDWQTKLPFSLDFMNSDTAQVIMIEGKSGCGKTYLAEESVIELTAFNVHCSVTDIKGGEWNKVGKYVDMLEIDMTGNGARFVNTMRIDDLNCDTSNCTEAYEAAISYTVGLFEVATNLQSNEGNPADLRAILNQAVEKVFTTNGVNKKNPETFGVTKDFKYGMVLDAISTLQNSRSFTEEQRKLCSFVKTRCSTYFMGEGRYSESFKRELTIGEIINVPLIVYNFNKNRGETLDIIDNLRVYMARCMDSRKHFIRKQQGLHQAVFYEELQRCGGMSTFIENICSDVTGSRSNNLTVFLLLNSIETFDASIFAPIRSNITTKIIGKSNPKDIEKLAKDYDCADIEHYMKLIGTNAQNKYEHCFAVSYDTGEDRDKLILKTVVPKEMEDQFRTRDRMAVGA